MISRQEKEKQLIESRLFDSIKTIFINNNVQISDKYLMLITDYIDTLGQLDYENGADPRSCGNYLDQNLPMAKFEANKFYNEVLLNFKRRKFNISKLKQIYGIIFLGGFMEDLEKELIEMVRIFDSCQIPEEMQREIITEGVYFLFDDNNHASLDCFKFAELLTLCKSLDSDFDANKLLDDIHGYVPPEYEETVKFFIDLEKRKKLRK